MAKHSSAGFIVLFLILLMPTIVLGNETYRKKRPAKSTVSKTDPTLSMTNQRQRKLVKVKRNFARKKRLSMIQTGSNSMIATF